MKRELVVRPVGIVRSSLTDRHAAPKQGHEGAPDAWIEVAPEFSAALHGISVGDELIVLTWFHESDRGVLQVHPRGDRQNPLTGVFATRSPARPNPVGLPPVTVRAVEGNRLLVGPLEAIDGTPVVDLKPALSC